MIFKYYLNVVSIEHKFTQANIEIYLRLKCQNHT